MQTVLAV